VNVHPKLPPTFFIRNDPFKHQERWFGGEAIAQIAHRAFGNPAYERPISRRARQTPGNIGS